MRTIADDPLGLIHSLATTLGHVQDITQVDRLLHEKKNESGVRGIRVLKNGRIIKDEMWVSLSCI